MRPTTKTTRRRTCRPLAAGLLLVAACTAGTITDVELPPQSESPHEPDEPTPIARPSACRDEAPAAQPLLRLTHVQHRNTLADLFGGVAQIPAVALPEETMVAGYYNNAAGQTPSLGLVEGYFAAAAALAEAATAPAALPKLAPCAAGAKEATCGAAFIEAFGRRAFRRPLHADEAARLRGVFEEASSAGGYRDGIATVVQAMLMAPQFLYRVEGSVGASGAGAIALTSHELASRLSYLLWDTMPDAKLMAAADADELATAEGLEAQARRMLADDRARAVVARFHHQWLRLEKLDEMQKDPQLFPKYGPAVAASMRDSVRRFVDHAFWDDGTLTALLTDGHAFVDGNLAPLYDVMPPAGAGMSRLAVQPGKRAGILTQAGLLSALAKPRSDSPVFRGLFVMEHRLCMELKAPQGIPPLEEPKAGDPPRTTRQRHEQSHSPPTCAVCHKQIDGIGFGFGNFDAVGQWRDTENGVPVDARGELVGTGDADGPFSGVAELAQRLAGSARVQECVTNQWFRYAFGRVESAGDRCARRSIQDELVDAKGDMKAVLLAIVKSDAFRFRPPTAP